MNRVYTAGTELRARINRHKNKKYIFAQNSGKTLCKVSSTPDTVFSN